MEDKYVVKYYGGYATFPTYEEAHSEKALIKIRMQMLDCVKELCEYCDVLTVHSECPIYSTLGECFTVGWKIKVTFKYKALEYDRKCRICYISPDMKYVIQRDEFFEPAYKYSDKATLRQGEIGRIKKNRYVLKTRGDTDAGCESEE